MTTTLWDTNGADVVKALAAERRASGAVAAGMVLSLIVVVDERDVAAAEEAARTAASEHPCRLLIVIRQQPGAGLSRLDAEVQVGGRLGPGEAVVLRMWGRLALHAESVVLPLLAPDTPVVTWWYGAPPDQIATDPLGVLASRRVTSSMSAPDQLAALRQRAEDYAPGDTDLAWSRATLWRGVLAAAFDAVSGRAVGGRVEAEPDDPSAALITGWLSARLDVPIDLVESRGPGTTAVHLQVQPPVGEPTELALTRADGRSAVLHRPGNPERNLPLPQRDTGECLAEELRRLDADQPYAEALGTWTGLQGLSERSGQRQHVWQDPAWQEGAAS